MSSPGDLKRAAQEVTSVMADLPRRLLSLMRCVSPHGHLRDDGLVEVQVP